MTKILAIDDNNDNLITLGAIIKESFPDLDFDTALSGEKGIELAISTSPDVIFLDIIMPNMDGFEVCRRLKQNEQLCDIPVVFLTASKENKENRLKALEVGGEAFLYKPIDETELVAQIRAMVKIKEFASQKRNENERLSRLVAERTQELVQSHAETLELVNELKAEISIRRKTEEQLSESELHFRTLADSGQALIWTSGIDKKCNYFNQPWLDFTGRTLKQELGDGWTEGVHPDDLQQCVKIYVNAFDRQEKFSMDYRVLNASGEYRWIQDDGSPRFNSKGEFIGFIGHCLDITDRKQVEEKLIEEQLFNHAIIENLPGIFYLYSYPELQLIKWNKNHETMLDLTADELKARFLVSWRRTEVKDHVISVMHQVAKNGFGQTEASFYKKDNSEIPFILTGVRLDIRGETFIMGFGIDITDRKKAEEALKESEVRLHELVATKDKFFSIISHDLKNPFNSILGLSNLLVEQIREKNFDGIEEYAAIIQKSSMQVFDLLVNLLEWSRAQTGRMEFSPEYIEMVALTNEVTELLGDQAKQKSITIFKELPLNILIYADKAMISTVLRNIISNAIKFTHPNGQINISAQSVEEGWIFAVKDNGVGMKNKNVEKLFSIAENQTTLGTKNERGTGLGLILCKEFIEKHGGIIWVESEVGKGSTFYFTLPGSY